MALDCVGHHLSKSLKAACVIIPHSHKTHLGLSTAARDRPLTFLHPPAHPGVLLVAAGTDPFHLVDAAVAAAAALSGGAAPRAAKQLPASLDGFGWCVMFCFVLNS